MKADQQIEAGVMAVLDKVGQAYVERDINKLLAQFAPEPDVLMFGTGVDERRVGLDQIRTQAERDWSQSDSATFLWNWQSVSTFGSCACVAAEGSVRAQAGGQELSIPVRLTATLEPREGVWRIVQAHFSAPLAGEASGESFPTSGQSQ